MNKLITSIVCCIGIFSFACSSDDDDPQIKSLKVCTELSNNKCSSHHSELNPNVGSIYSSAELVGIKNAEVAISLWAWDGQEWLEVAQTTINNGDKNLVHATFTNNGPWPMTDYEVEYFVDSDPQLTAVIDFVVQ